MLLRRYHERTEPESAPDTEASENTETGTATAEEEEKVTEPETSPVPDEGSTKK
ncbi:MAG: hypothetical protein L0G87_01395 [Renibacterium salmoninarum]|nr:hypothetical protein [Renibacterium salmoninarum]